MIVYQIINEVTFDRYIGSSTYKNHNTRLIQHRGFIRRGSHPNWKIRELANTYGINSFSYEVIESYRNNDRDFLLQREQHYIDILKPTLNISKHSKSVLGIKKSDEEKKHMSAKISEMIKSGQILRFAHNKGKKSTYITRLKQSYSKQKHRLCVFDRYTLKLLYTFKSKMDLEETLGIKSTVIDTIHKNSTGIYKKCIILKEGVDPLKNITEEKESSRRIKPNPIGVYDLEDNLLRVYPSKHDCSRTENICRNHFKKKSFGVSGYSKNGLIFKTIK